MDNEIKVYEEDGLTKFLRWSFIIVLSFNFIYIAPVLVRDATKFYCLNDWENFIIVVFILALYPVIIGMVLDQIVEFFTVAIKIEFREGSIIGYSRYGKNRFEMRYDEIEIIKDRSSIYPQNSITLLGNGKKMYISVGIYPLADIVEEIERRAINLKESKLDDLKRNGLLWVRGKNKEDKRKKIKGVK